VAAVSPSALASKLNPTCRRALEGAAGLCLSRTNYNVEIEHWLLKLLEPANTDLTKILRHYDADPSRVNRELTRSLDQLKTGNARAPALSPEIQDLMREAWVISSLNLNAYRIRSGYLLTALLTDRNLSSRIRGSSPELAKIPGDQLLKEVATLIAGSSEDQEAGEPVGAAPTAAGGAPGPVAGSRRPPWTSSPSTLPNVPRKVKSILSSAGMRKSAR
jgi:type VI secretion system protein VasG